jgi:hypothetical protein
MSQFYFDYFVNKVGKTANALEKVVPNNKLMNEEIKNWEL